MSEWKRFCLYGLIVRVIVSPVVNEVSFGECIVYLLVLKKHFGESLLFIRQISSCDVGSWKLVPTKTSNLSWFWVMSCFSSYLNYK